MRRRCLGPAQPTGRGHSRRFQGQQGQYNPVAVLDVAKGPFIYVDQPQRPTRLCGCDAHQVGCPWCWQRGGGRQQGRGGSDHRRTPHSGVQLNRVAPVGAALGRLALQQGHIKRADRLVSKRPLGSLSQAASHDTTMTATISNSSWKLNIRGMRGGSSTATVAAACLRGADLDAQAVALQRQPALHAGPPAGACAVGAP